MALVQPISAHYVTSTGEAAQELDCTTDLRGGGGGGKEEGKKDGSSEEGTKSEVLLLPCR